MITNNISVIIVAGGKGVRFGTVMPKQFQCIGEIPILIIIMRRFMEYLPGARIILTLPGDQFGFWQELCERYGLPPDSHILCEGGRTRFHSVKNALPYCQQTDFTAIHDGVRPLISKEVIIGALKTAEQKGNAVPACLPVDSYRIITGDDGNEPVDRNRLRIIQTPQVFPTAALTEAYRRQYDPGFTDDASVMESSGHKIFLCEGSPRNIKITFAEDLILAESIIKAESHE